MFLGPIFLLLLLVAVVGALALAGRWFGGQQHHPAAPPRREPLDILKERFARGEIDKGEFEERRRVLGE